MVEPRPGPLNRLLLRLGEALTKAALMPASDIPESKSDQDLDRIIDSDVFLHRHSQSISQKIVISEATGKSVGDQWYRRLSQMADQFAEGDDEAASRRGDFYHLSALTKSTSELFEKLYARYNEIVTKFNTTCDLLGSPRVRGSVSDIKDLSSNSNSPEWIAEFSISTGTRRLTFISKPGAIHVYMTPNSIAIGPQDSYRQSNLNQNQLKLSIELSTLGKERIWTVYSLPLSEAEIDFLSRALFRDLVLMTASDAAVTDTGNKFESIQNLERMSGGNRYKDSVSLESEPTEDLVRDLVFAQQNIVHKLLNQQEEIQADIARELHDSVLADILMLARRLASEKSVSPESLKRTLEKCGETIREICRGLVPRDLKDWGLETVVQDLVDKLAERTEVDCTLEVEDGLPEFPSAVQLHIFRIVQECMNNIEKYAEASAVSVSMKNEGQVFTIIIEDDGKGFELSEKSFKTHSEGGFGLRGLEERVEIIRAFYPTRFKVESRENKGTRITLELQTPTFR